MLWSAALPVFSCLAWGFMRLLLPKVAAKMTEMYHKIPPLSTAWGSPRPLNPLTENYSKLLQASVCLCWAAA